MHLRTAVLHLPLTRGSSDTVSFGSGLGQVTWTPFKVKDPENSSHCLHPLLRKAGLGFCGGLPDEEPDLHWKGHFGLNVP